MQLSIVGILTDEELTQVRDTLSGLPFGDGRRTAGWAAKQVKANEQAEVSSAIAPLQELVTSRLLANPVFALAVRPQRILRTIVSRYRAGHAYGSHVDDAVMDGGRADVSFTLFLSAPSDYAGGELVIETASDEAAVKLPAGAVFAYPSTTLHRVAAVTAGERLAMVGWVHSTIRCPQRRELLFDLDTARRSLFDREGKTTEFDLLSKANANLLRMWVEP